LNTLDHRFLSKVAVDVSLRGQGFGRRALQAAQQLLRDAKVQELFLEISHEEGFLIQSDKELDFVVVDRVDVECESGTYDIVLMKCVLGQ
jgi:N-acetylglutamate synthase-like GNAT family acetyltransferase